jgi:hypothetical protein
MYSGSRNIRVMGGRPRIGEMVGFSHISGLT